MSSPRPYRVHLSTGAVEIYARTAAAAVSAALELAGPDASVIRVCQLGDW